MLKNSDITDNSYYLATIYEDCENSKCLERLLKFYNSAYELTKDIERFSSVLDFGSEVLGKEKYESLEKFSIDNNSLYAINIKKTRENMIEEEYENPKIRIKNKEYIILQEKEINLVKENQKIKFFLIRSNFEGGGIESYLYFKNKGREYLTKLEIHTVGSPYNIELKGKLQPWVSAKDVILYVLKQLTVKGGVGYVMEYTGDGIKSLSVEDRATITNMGAELGATTSIFPSDEYTRTFLEKQSRGEDFVELLPDENAFYDDKLVVNLDELVPLAAFPHSPDNVHEIPKDKKLKVDQIAIGSCTNSSYSDFMKLAAILDGKKVHPDVSLVLSPGSSNIMKMISENNALAKFIAAGARLLEAACGPCIGMGQAPKTDGISLRTFNRNFKGRCGTMSAGVYLVSTETAAASAITGYLTDPRELGAEIIVEEPEKFEISDNYFIFPNPNEEEAKREREAVKIVMGPNIKPFPIGEALQDSITRKVILKTGDNITTDDICPSNAALLPFRSNIPKLSEHCFETIIPDFKERAEKNNGGIVVGGENYGQGSSREHAALLPLYLGIKAVIAKSFARIHKANLINSGIIPLEFENAEDYDKIDEYDELQLSDIPNSLINGRFIVKNITKNVEFPAKFNGSNRELKILKFGGYLKFATSDEFLS